MYDNPSRGLVFVKIVIIMVFTIVLTTVKIFDELEFDIVYKTMIMEAVMATSFEYVVQDFYNGYPVLTEGFADALVEFFAGGHTPEIRDVLLELQKVSAHSDNGVQASDDYSVFRYDFEDDQAQLSDDFATSLIEFFAGGHTPEIRNQLVKLEKATKSV